MKILSRILPLAFLSVFFLSPTAEGKAEKDSLFRLLQADQAQILEEHHLNYRRVKGNARFLHNDTYLLCDSASWNVDANYIEAFGNVQLIQNNTVLKSEELFYDIDENLAKFRGGVVELFDKDGNTLRTNQLDYNTKDSVGVFRYGGAVMDSSKNVIESRTGTYDAKISTFTFEDEVELYMDSILIKTNTLRYRTDLEKAFFGAQTYMWRDDGFLTAKGGSYDRHSRVAYFADEVYMNNPDYEAWTEELYYDQQTGQVDMYLHSQILDTTNKTFYIGNHLQYLPDTSMAILTRDPAIVYFGENENHEVDTLYAGADSIIVRSVPKCDIPENEISDAGKRKEDILFDALAKTRAEQAAERERQRIEKMRQVGLLPPEGLGNNNQAPADSLAAPVDSTSILADLPLPEALPAAPDSLDFPQDSLAVSQDSLAVEPPRDTTPVRFVSAYRNFRLFRSDMQAACDSAVFNELDSIVRMHGRPILWNDVKNQLTSEEMFLLMQDGNVTRGSMITNAWLISEQDTSHFNQIKSTEMLGFFRNNELYRFDALGGVNAVFYLVEDNVASTINIKESKTLTAMIKDGNAQRLLYMETIKSDAYPVSDLSPEKQKLKDFEWRAEERPESPLSITDQTLHTTIRDRYESVRRPTYRQTDRYFDNYMRNLLNSNR